MRLRRMSALAAGIAVAIVLMPGRAVADLLLDPGSATTGSTVRDPGSLGFGQGVSDPLSFTLQSGSTYYFGAIQGANTEIVAPFFSPPVSVTQNGLTTLDTGTSNNENFIVPRFTTLASVSFPLQLYGTQGATGGPTPEPSLALLLACGVLATVWRSRQISKAVKR
jgi:hypothetical protein